MRAMQILSLPVDATPDEVAAALAAVACMLEAEQAEPDADRPVSAWRVAAAQEAQELPAARSGRHSGWASAERARREGRWSTGILGL